jgi:hypothetical protein
MTRSVAAVVLLFLGVLAWAPGRAPAQTSLVGRPAPEIAGGPWLNSQPLTLEALRGRVVLVDFWTSG